jgi:hypothetical protein
MYLYYTIYCVADLIVPKGIAGFIMRRDYTRMRCPICTCGMCYLVLGPAACRELQSFVNVVVWCEPIHGVLSLLGRFHREGFYTAVMLAGVFSHLAIQL